MPAFSADWQPVAEAYKIRFMPDGYPGRYDDGELWAHPMYGVYVLKDYMHQYQQKPTEELLTAIRIVANAAIGRMDEYQGALVFWYPAKPDLVSALYEPMYSGLTQSYYALRLYQVYEITGDEQYRLAAKKVFRSLLIPEEYGGVYYRSIDGVSIVETPLQPNNLTLNGWLSIIVNIKDYFDLTGDEAALELSQDNIQTLARILYLYDAPAYMNSRYGLSGFQYFKLVFSENPEGMVINNISLEIPKEGTFDVYAGNGSRWEYYVFENDVYQYEQGVRPKNRTVRMNLVLSRISYPEENRLNVVVDSPNELQVDVYAYVGEYSPLAAAQVNCEWHLISTYQIAKGIDKVRVDIPWDSSDLIAYPTNFLKATEGKQYNVYHFIHIDRLQKIYSFTGIDIFRTYADKWEEYTKEWPQMDLYKGLEYVPYP